MQKRRNRNEAPVTEGNHHLTGHRFGIVGGAAGPDGLWRPIRLLQWYESKEVRDELCNLFHHRLELRLVGNIRKAVPDLIQEEPYRQLLEDWDRFPDVDWSSMKNPDTFQTQVIMRQGTENLERYVQQRDTILREFTPFSEKDRTILQSILRR